MPPDKRYLKVVSEGLKAEENAGRDDLTQQIGHSALLLQERARVSLCQGQKRMSNFFSFLTTGQGRMVVLSRSPSTNNSQISQARMRLTVRSVEVCFGFLLSVQILNHSVYVDNLLSGITKASTFTLQWTKDYPLRL